MKKLFILLLFVLALQLANAHEPVHFSFFENGCELIVPNAFTPNGDGVNDEFFVTIPKNCNLHRYDLRIYDQFGREVFQTQDPKIKWDGTYDGIPLPRATYLWKLTAQFEFENEVIDKKGTVLIIK
ncbi:MAG: gliding motility-associated C-terminal domain-containing protein [Schleiferiaceae bacterium]|nr:gliding motility-associated C-terminal domain-containing protein [Schleiferiaceae bacterium]